MNILEKLADASYERVQKAKEDVSENDLKEKCMKLDGADHGFYKALAEKGLTFICECKKASPSKGLIEPDYDPYAIADEYHKAGADCISVLTEETGFQGSLEHLKAASAVDLPVLRKDFITDPYMIYEARLAGASAVLLIAELLSQDQMKKMIRTAGELGMDALCECRDESQIEKAANAGASIIGINNRNLKDFSVDFQTFKKLADSIPDGILAVAESGITCADDVLAVCKAGADGVLIGETMMRSSDKAKTLADLKALI